MLAGISSFAFGWTIAAPPEPARPSFGADALLDFAVAHRVPVIQFGDNLPLHALNGGALTALSVRAHKAGIAIETGARGLTAEYLSRYITISRQLGARILRFVIDAQGYEPDISDVISIVHDALPALRDAGVTLGIENHDRFPAATLRQIVDTIGSEHFGICLDTANSLGAGEGIGEVLDELAPITVNLHLKDFMIERLPYLMGFTVTGRPLGEGMLPINHVITSVARHRRCGSAILETWPPPESDPLATLAKELLWAEQGVVALRAALQRAASTGPIVHSPKT